MRRCGCEDGDACTKTTVCSLESAVQDATDMKDEIIQAAKEWVDLELSSGVPIKQGTRRVVEMALIEAVSNYDEWEQNL